MYIAAKKDKLRKTSFFIYGILKIPALLLSWQHYSIGHRSIKNVTYPFSQSHLWT